MRWVRAVSRVAAILLLVGQTFSAQAKGPARHCLGRKATIVGTERDDLLRTKGSDIVVGLGGDDVVRGSGFVCGGRGDDRIRTKSVSPYLIGGPGNDRLISSSGGLRSIQTSIGYATGTVDGGTGDDEMLLGDFVVATIEGGPGNDRIITGSNGSVWGGPGDDYLRGPKYGTLTYSKASGGVSVSLKRGIAKGEGRDTIRGFWKIRGSPFDDRLEGRGGRQYIYGEKGDDHLLGRGGKDDLFAAEGKDRIDGGAGRDGVYGGRGNDDIDGGRDIDVWKASSGLWEGRGISWIEAPMTIDLRRGFALAITRGRDRVARVERFVGSYSHSNTFIGDDNRNIFIGGIRPDVMYGRGGDDYLIAENDYYQSASDDFISGGKGNDRIANGAGSDRVYGGPGRDLVTWASLFFDRGVNVDLRTGEAVFAKNKGEQQLQGIEDIVGTDGRDAILGDRRHNVLMGSAGNDDVQGRGGNDTLKGGGGQDSLDGGSGTDSCVKGETLVRCE